MNTHTIIDKQEAKAVNTGAKAQSSLYAAHEKVFPKRAEGNFRKLKWIIMAITLGIYYLTPWIRWDRGPFAPDQAVLLDMAHRRFYFFFIEIWPQEFYFVAGLMVMAGVGLFLVTSVVGRAWCGYSCPQTVWTDLFIKVEELVQGDRNARIRLDKAPWSLRKISLIGFTHFIWLVIAVATGGAWIFYFADAPTLLKDFVTLQAPFVAYGTVAVLTATTYLLGGIMREQVCIYMCPWPRIQAAMLDEDSLVVTYNDWRGEPRSAGTKKAAAAGLAVGDCIDCNACVAVCPTASTSVTASSSNASPVRSASMPATASWTRSASRAASSAIRRCATTTTTWTSPARMPPTTSGAASIRRACTSPVAASSTA